MEPSKCAGGGRAGTAFTCPGFGRCRTRLRAPRVTTPEGIPLLGALPRRGLEEALSSGGGQLVTRKRSAVRRCLKMAAEEPQQQKQEPLGSDSEGTDQGRAARPGLAGAMPDGRFPRKPGLGRLTAK